MGHAAHHLNRHLQQQQHTMLHVTADDTSNLHLAAEVLVAVAATKPGTVAVYCRKLRSSPACTMWGPASKVEVQGCDNAATVPLPPQA